MGLKANPRTYLRGEMAIYSLHHRPIGKSTQAEPYTAAAHIGYITRKKAMSAMEKARLPGESPRDVARHLRECEDADRKNARVIDKVMLALPRELNAKQRVDLVRDFAEHVTKGKAPWLAAFHDKGKDAHNPHCHLVIRDRDPTTGRRVIGTSEVGSTERLREQWETYANRALKAAGRAERIDRRTLEEQGIQREPTIHEGPQAQAMDKRGKRPTSRRRSLRNRPGSKRPRRDVDYKKIDRGQSRPEENRARRASAVETERDMWAAVDADNQRRELAGLAPLQRAGAPETPTASPPRKAKVPGVKQNLSKRLKRELKQKKQQRTKAPEQQQRKPDFAKPNIRRAVSPVNVEPPPSIKRSADNSGRNDSFLNRRRVADPRRNEKALARLAAEREREKGRGR